MLGDHLLAGRRLMELIRYPGIIKIQKESVAEHSWFVSVIAHALATWEKYKFKQNDIDMEKIYFYAIYHDYIEAYTGDIATPAKNKSANFRKVLHETEILTYEEDIIPNLPESWRDSYMNMHTEMSELNTIESQIVKASDLIERIFECTEEIKRCNKEPFLDILKKDLVRLGDMDLISVNYFLKYPLKDLGAYEYLNEDMKKKLEETDFSMYF